MCEKKREMHWASKRENGPSENHGQCGISNVLAREASRVWLAANMGHRQWSGEILYLFPIAQELYYHAYHGGSLYKHLIGGYSVCLLR